jgi:transmembrane sensor
VASVYDFPDRAVIEEEAGRWLIRLDSDEPLPPADVEALREWLGRSPVHREELSNLISFYGKMNILTELAVPLGVPEPASAARRVRRPAFYRLAAAAAVVVVGSLIALTALLNQDPLLSTNGLYSTTVGAQETISLADWSTVQLNTNTRIEVEYEGDYRNIRLLQGEAYFTVAKNADRPFRVYAGSGRIEAVGTAFAVHVMEDDVSVTVAEGKVALAALRRSDPKRPDTPDPRTQQDDDIPDESDAETIGMLTAGQSTSIAGTVQEDTTSPGPGPAIRTIDPQELARRLSWRKGILIFSGEPLEQVVKEISRYTTTTIEIKDPAVRAISIGGQFRVGDTEALLDALESNFDLRVTRLGIDHVQLTSASRSST